MKLKLLNSSLILTGTLLAGLAVGHVRLVKDGVGKVVSAALARINGSKERWNLRVDAGEGVVGILRAGNDIVHGFDDFFSDDIGSAGKWAYVGETPYSFVPSQPGHQGIISIPSGTKTSVNELIGQQVCVGPPATFPGVSKCVARFVVCCDKLFTAKGAFDGEWYVGIANPDGTGNVYAGAMLSFAPGFEPYPSSNLLAGSYTSQSSNTETPTNFKIEQNTWYDLIISWTPKVIKYYAAVYGQTPTLIATNTTNISTEPQYLLIGNNRYKEGFPSVTLLVDKVEWSYATSEGESYLQEDLVKF